VFQFVYDYQEQSYAEAASALGLSTQRIKQTICEVRKRLRAVLTDEES
jgi:DNA-directed RNA polymerase specialized sigma24 family protein